MAKADVATFNYDALQAEVKKFDKVTSLTFNQELQKKTIMETIKEIYSKYKLWFNIGGVAVAAYGVYHFFFKK